MKKPFNLIKGQKNDGRADKVFLCLVILLSVYGTVMVFTSGYAYAAVRYSDPFYFIKRQLVWLFFGIVALAFGMRLKSLVIRRAVPIAYALTLVLLVLTLVIGFVGNGAQRWIAIGPITIQPSEIAKLTMVMALSAYFSRFEKKATAPKTRRESFIWGTLLPALLMLVPILLVMLQKHLSCIIILGTIGLLVIVMSGIKLKYISGFTALGALGVSYIAFFTDYTKERITVWRDPEAYKLTGGWQTLQGLMAIGSGGLFGKGLGKGELKYCYVSEPANDMIFAILCEELGFVGAFVALLLFALLVYRGFMIAMRTEGTFERLLCLGIITKVAVQTLLNVAVVTNTIPNTGISLPFFSYGGSSLIMLFFEMGVVLGISRRARIHK